LKRLTSQLQAVEPLLDREADRLATAEAAKAAPPITAEAAKIIAGIFRRHKHVAEQKDANSHALLEVAMRTEIGLGTQISPSTALVWYRRAAGKGCPHARKYVEIWNELGRRTDVLRDIKIAADRGSAIGQYLCGWTKLSGFAPADPKSAAIDMMKAGTVPGSATDREAAAQSPALPQ
jgi:hypothetical protein